MRISSNLTAPVSKMSVKTKAIALSLLMLPAVALSATAAKDTTEFKNKRISASLISNPNNAMKDNNFLLPNKPKTNKQTLLLKNNDSKPILVQNTNDGDKSKKEISKILIDQYPKYAKENQLEIYKITYNSKFQEIKEYAASNIYKLDKDNQVGAFQYTIDSGNEGAIKAAISQYNKYADENKGKIKYLIEKSKIVGLKSQIDADNRQIDEKNGQVLLISSSISSQQSIYSMSQMSLDTINSTLDFYRSMGYFVTIPAEYYSLQRMANDASAEMARLKQQKAGIEGDISKLQQDIIRLQKQIDNINAGISAMQ